MNAPTRPAELAEPKIELIPVAAIAPSDTHIQQLRRKRYDLEALKDLTASIAKLGVQQPGIVRKLPALRGLAAYELVCGERRWRASRQADVAHFPAIIRVLTDAEVLEIQLVENIQRESLHPLEEAAGYEELMKVAQITADQVGEKVGLSRSWVYSRLNLLKLDGEARKALEDGRLDVSRALVVASVAPPNQRAEALRLALETGYQSNKPMYSVRELRHKIGADRLTMQLTGAPFPRDDAKLLPEMGACGPCRFRTGNCDPEALDPDVCTNLSCYHLKVKAQGERVRRAVLDAGGKVLRGEDARQVSPSVKTVYGHIDLDLGAEGVDDFPEKAPVPPKDLLKQFDDADDADAALENWPPYRAYLEREALWQPRSYRALLEGLKYTPVVIEDPKTKLVRELLPFKAAQALLKKKGFALPTYYNRKRPTHHRGGAGGANTAKRDPEKEAAAERERQQEEEIKRKIALRVLEQVKAKHDGSLGVAELAVLGASAFDNVGDRELVEQICKWFGFKNPHYRWREALAKLSSKDLPRVILLGVVTEGLDGESYHESAKVTDAICARLKVDRKKIAAEVRAEAKKLAEKKSGKK